MGDSRDHQGLALPLDRVEIVGETAASPARVAVTPAFLPVQEP
jgi:hypothetical protein